jgi:hypothetical protein
VTTDFAEAIRTNLASPAVMFFLLGMIAAIVRSDLKIPEAMYVAITVYLLSAIGFKGGAALSSASFSEVWRSLLVATGLGLSVPLWCYPILRFVGRLAPADAAAIAGHYGSVSAVTFTAATAYLQNAGAKYEDYAAAFLAIMESPAIIIAIVLGRMATRSTRTAGTSSWSSVLHEAVFGRSVLLLAGGLVIGLVCGQRGLALTKPFLVDPFYGVLCLFLLEMGSVAGRRLGDLRRAGAFLAAFAIIMPIIHGALGVALGHAAGLSIGGATLMGVLAASSSYIAAPAAIRLSLPEANPTLYLTSSLVITFPFNITIGIPMYYAMATWWAGGAA